VSCNKPLTATRAPSGEVFLGADHVGTGRALELPCGKCVGCKMDRARAWQIRIMHEAQLFDSNLCVTLDYSDANLKSRSLEYPDFAGFMKRLRRRLSGVSIAGGRRPIRFFVAGEYGEKFERPHFHAILFNVLFPDMQKMHNGYYSSKLCEDLWEDRGRAVIDRLDSAAAAYVAGYTLKKARHSVYVDSLVDPNTGLLSDRRPPFVVMSRRPGIGAWWFERYGGDMFPHDFAVAEGSKYKVPRYYLERFRKVADACQVEEIMHGRYLRAQERREDSTPDRRAVKEELALRRAEFYSQRTL